MKSQDPLWFHVDMDAFYASVEQRDHPEYRGRPVIVGAMPNKRGVVATCSYEARALGIHSAMPVSHAYRLCPDGIYVPPRMKHYAAVSAQIMELFQDFSPEIRQVSIDEAFINMTGSEGIFGSAEEAAVLLKKRVRERTGLIITVGAASNRLVAKMASGFRKPDGLTIVAVGKNGDFVRQLSLDALWGVGKKTRQRLTELNITSIDQLLLLPPETLGRFFGKAGGNYLFQIIRGIDPGIYDALAKQHSISHEHTFDRDCRNRDALEDVLFHLVYSIVFRLHWEHCRSHTLVLKLRLGDFSTSSIQKSLEQEIKTVEDCYALAIHLLNKKWDSKSPVRLIGIGFSKVTKREESNQAELFEHASDRRFRAEIAVLALHEKYHDLKLSKARNFIQEKNQKDKD